MQTDKGIRSAALQEAVSVFMRGTGVLWKAVLSHEWQWGDKGRLKVKQGIHREDYQEKACISYYPFHSGNYVPWFLKTACCRSYVCPALGSFCMLCCELGQCWDRQLITLFKTFPLRKEEKKKKSWCNSPGLLLWLCNCIATQSPRVIVSNNIPTPIYTEGPSGCISLPVFSALCKEWKRESEIRRMKKVMKFSVQTLKVHSVLDVRGKSEKEASAFQTLTSLCMGWHWSGRQRTQTGCWSSAAEAFPNGISHADSAQISASLSSTPRHRLIDSENLLFNHTHRAHKCATVKIILA